MMKAIATASLVALSFLILCVAARSSARGANENHMPCEIDSDAETKPEEASSHVAAASLPAPQQSPTPESSPQPSPKSAQQSSPQSSPQSPLKLPLVNPKLVVSKSARQLTLYSDGRVVRTYSIALGGNPVDDKIREGDRATPEGDFYVCVKNERSNFYLSLGLNYPNREDAERGLRDKLITRREYERIVRAIRNRQCPPWDTALGGEIFIHGGGTEGDWTWGCVGLVNADIRELFDAVPLGASVRIER